LQHYPFPKVGLSENLMPPAEDQGAHLNMDHGQTGCNPRGRLPAYRKLTLNLSKSRILSKFLQTA